MDARLGELEEQAMVVVVASVVRQLKVHKLAVKSYEMGGLTEERVQLFRPGLNHSDTLKVLRDKQVARETSVSIRFSQERCGRYQSNIYLNSKDGLPIFYK